MTRRSAILLAEPLVLAAAPGQFGHEVEGPLNDSRAYRATPVACSLFAGEHTHISTAGAELNVEIVYQGLTTLRVFP